MNLGATLQEKHLGVPTWGWFAVGGAGMLMLMLGRGKAAAPQQTSGVVIVHNDAGPLPAGPPAVGPPPMPPIAPPPPPGNPTQQLCSAMIFCCDGYLYVNLGGGSYHTSLLPVCPPGIPSASPNAPASGGGCTPPMVAC